jgi:hypothetical protein
MYWAVMRCCNIFSVTNLALGNMKYEMSSSSSVMGLTLAKMATDKWYWKLLYLECFFSSVLTTVSP